MIQVSSGLIRGLKLKSPRSSNTRPTTERTRQSIFNILRNYFITNAENRIPILEEAQVADLFSGTGAWGIDAVSNGARSVFFIESSREAVSVLKDNAAIATHALLSQDIESNFEICANDILKGYQRIPQNTRVIFADPPYSKGYFEALLNLEAQHAKIAPHGLMIIEESSKQTVDFSLATKAKLTLFDQKNYGDSTIYFFVKSVHETSSLSG